MEGQVRTPVEILELTRRIFAGSHWAAGTYAGRRWDEKKGKDKAIACSVGGLRYAALAPMENALDEGWMLANMTTLGQMVPHKNTPLNAESDPAAVNYLVAVEALAAEADGYRFANEYEDTYPGVWGVDTHGGPEELFGRIETCEEIIVGWNDEQVEEEPSEEDRLAAVNDTILPTFDRAIAALKGAVAA